MDSKKSKVILIIIGIAFIALIIGSVFAYRSVTSKEDNKEKLEQEIEKQEKTQTANSDKNKEEKEQLKEAKVLDYTVFDREGNEVKIKDLKGKPLMINLWASWCPPCKAEMPDLNEVYKEYGEEVQFMAINLTDGMRETREKAEQFLEGKNFEFPVYFDQEEGNNLGSTIYSIPTTYFIDKDGNLVKQVNGMMSKGQMKNNLELIK